MRKINNNHDLPSGEETIESGPNAWEMSFLQNTDNGNIGTQISEYEPTSKSPEFGTRIKNKQIENTCYNFINFKPRKKMTKILIG